MWICECTFEKQKVKSSGIAMKEKIKVKINCELLLFIVL